MKKSPSASPDFPVREFFARFADERACLEHIMSVRFGGTKLDCPSCGTVGVQFHKLAERRVYACPECRFQIAPTANTILHDTRTPLVSWFYAMYLFCTTRHGVSGKELQRQLGVTYKTAWFMMHRIRESMKDDGSPLGGEGVTVEADEAFVGGKQTRRAYREVAPKKMVVALIERGGRARSFHIADITSKTLRGALVTNVDRLSHLRTDGAWAYRRVGPEYASHQYVDHRRAEYGAGDKHSNTAENFFSILKRGVIGTYHHWSQAHIHRYLAEFDFRYSTKDVTDKERSDAMLRGIVGKRLTYRRTGPLFA